MSACLCTQITCNHWTENNYLVIKALFWTSCSFFAEKNHCNLNLQYASLLFPSHVITKNNVLWCSRCTLILEGFFSMMVVTCDCMWTTYFLLRMRAVYGLQLLSMVCHTLCSVRAVLQRADSILQWSLIFSSSSSLRHVRVHELSRPAAWLLALINLTTLCHVRAHWNYRGTQCARQTTTKPKAWRYIFINSEH